MGGMMNSWLLGEELMGQGGEGLMGGLDEGLVGGGGGGC